MYVRRTPLLDHLANACDVFEVTIDGRCAQRALGKLRRLRPRDIWPAEARDFTYWLRQNPDLFGALGLDI